MFRCEHQGGERRKRQLDGLLKSVEGRGRGGHAGARRVPAAGKRAADPIEHAAPRLPDGSLRKVIKLRRRKMPAVQFPQNDMAGSVAQPLLDTTDGKFGPYAGQFLVAEWTYPRILRADLEKVGGEYQGSCFILVEGNYLLLDEEPWSRLASLFDFSIFVNVPRNELERRLMERWRGQGKSDEDARAWIASNDMPNIERVLARRREADLVIG